MYFNLSVRLHIKQQYESLLRRIKASHLHIWFSDPFLNGLETDQESSATDAELSAAVSITYPSTM